jgi:Ca2+-binding RTX toxin-like protein
MNGRNTTDDMTVANIAGGRVRFDRLAPGAFGLDMGTIERLTINSFAGDDKLVTAAGVTLPITVDAGPGNDAITTGDAADLVQGGEGVDTLNGGAGGDRILGNPGNDVMNGNAGDDVLVWNNGDGTDDMNGEDGLDRIEDNLGAADDVSALTVLNGKVRYDRTNAPFGLNIATSEVFELNTFGGNDTLDGGAGLGDVVDGQEGDDVLTVRDGAADLARGGIGTDTATADFTDVLVDVENRDVSAGPDTRGTAARVLTRRVTSKLKRGRYTAKIRVECPASEAGGCAGTLALHTARKINVRGAKVNVVVASKRFNLRPAQRRTLRVRLPKGVRALSRRGTLRLRATTTSRDAAGNVAQRSSRLAVKLVRR